MKPITLPDTYNYIGVFLTYRCNLNCDYCINKYSELSKVKELPCKYMLKGLSRVRTIEDLPLSLQGGEPTLIDGFYEIVRALSLKGSYIDLLTNGLFNAHEFALQLHPRIFKRQAKYASIRFSFHQKTSYELIHKVWYLQNQGYPVGIWGLKYPEMLERNRVMKERCRWLNIDYREKEYLGWYNGKLYGTYKYPQALDGKPKSCLCKPSELLIAPDGKLYRCHYELYKGINSYSHILDKEVSIPDDYLPCETYGLCNLCDVKTKTNRFQEYGHCSVDIKEVSDG